MTQSSLLCRIKEMEEFLGPYMDYQDDGEFHLKMNYPKHILWVYQYYQFLKRRHFKKRMRKIRVKTSI